jgi:hypothetical protein
MKPAGFSSFGPTRDGRQKPDLLAPGTDIVAARSQPPIEDGSIGMREPSLTTKSGTSMAAPHVTGTAAVLYEAAGRPLHAHELKRILLETASPSACAARRSESAFSMSTVPCDEQRRLRVRVSLPISRSPQRGERTTRPRRPQSVSTSLLNAAKLDAAVKKNPEYLEKLKIGKLTPFGTLDPAKDGAELAGRVAQVQHFARSRGLDLRYLGTKIDVDGILGYQTYLLLTRLAAEQAFATYLSNFGVEISNIERNKYSQENRGSPPFSDPLVREQGPKHRWRPRRPGSQAAVSKRSRGQAGRSELWTEARTVE